MCLSWEKAKCCSPYTVCLQNWAALQVHCKYTFPLDRGSKIAMHTLVDHTLLLDSPAKWCGSAAYIIGLHADSFLPLSLSHQDICQDWMMHTEIDGTLNFLHSHSALCMNVVLNLTSKQQGSTVDKDNKCLKGANENFLLFHKMINHIYLEKKRSQ